MTMIAALMTGLATSLHCAGMCGPIACGLGALSKTEGGRLAAASVYHSSRLISYAAIGAACGAIGRQPLLWFFDSPAVLLPWILVAVLLMVAFGWDQKIPRPKILNRLTIRARFKTGKFSAIGSAAAMGFLTPLLPCSPLYAVFAITLVSGSAAKGAEFMLAFGLGTVPLLWLAQHQFHRIRAMLSPTGMAKLRRGLALVTALMVAWRLHGTLLPSPAAEATPGKPETRQLPSCCH